MNLIPQAALPWSRHAVVCDRSHTTAEKVLFVNLSFLSHMKSCVSRYVYVWVGASERVHFFFFFFVNQITSVGLKKNDDSLLQLNTLNVVALCHQLSFTKLFHFSRLLYFDHTSHGINSGAHSIKSYSLYVIISY